MKHLDKLLSQNHKFAPDTMISLPVAKDHGYYAGILYAYLQDKQEEQSGYSDKYSIRHGIRWIPKLTTREILDALPVFPDLNTLNGTADKLQAEGLILTETTGAFLEPDHVTGRKRDIATWWHVSRDHVAKKSVPVEYFYITKRLKISALEAAAYGISAALILAHWRNSQVVEADDAHVWKRLSATELEKVLPMNERTARRHLKDLVKKGILVVHPTKPKLYRVK